MKKLLSVRGIVLILLVLALLLASCARATPTPVVTPAPTPKPPLDLKMGGLLGLSGPVAPWGLATLRGAEMAAETINAAGGIRVGGETYMIKLIPYDSKEAVTDAVTGARKLILDDKVGFIFGTIASAVHFAVGEIAAENKVLLFPIGPGGIGPKYPYTIFHRLDDREGWDGMYQYFAEVRPTVKTIVAINPDDSLGNDFASWSEDFAPKNGFTLRDNVLFPMDTIDFFPIMSAVVAKNPDAIDLGGTYPGFKVPIVEAAWKLGYEGEWLSYSFPLDLALQKIPAEYLQGYLAGFPDLDDPILGTYWNQFYARYLEKYPGEWNEAAPIGDYLMRLIKQGIEAANSVEPERVRGALLGLPEMEGWYGGVGKWGGLERYGINQILFAPIVMAEVQGEDLRAVARIVYDEQTETITYERLR